MKTVEIKVRISIPDSDSTDGEIQDFVEFNVGYGGGISLCNPLAGEEFEVENVEIISII